MFRKIFLLPILLLTLSPVFAQKKSEKKAILKQLETSHKLMEIYCQEGLADSLVMLFSPNCHLSMENQPLVESREGVGEYFKNDFLEGKKITTFSFTPEETKIYDEVILELGSCQLEYTRPIAKKLYCTSLNYMFVWKKGKDDKYRIRAAMWNSPKVPEE